MNYGERNLGEVAGSLVTSGAGVAGGFLGAAFIGRQIQNYVKKDAEITKFTDAAMAWSANNLPKIGIWYLAGRTRYAAAEPGEVLTPGKEAVVDARKAFAGSIVFDTLMRLANSGKNPATATIMGWQVLGSGEGESGSQSAEIQRLIQENSDLRAETNKLLQKMAVMPQGPPVIQSAVTPPAVEERERRYGQMQYETTPPEVIERERRYGQMQPARVAERERLFGFSSGKPEGTMDVASMFGML